LLPDVPTASESGLREFENTGWFGLFAPAGTPQDVISKIHLDTVKALGESQMKARLYVQGMNAVANSPAQFAALMDAESTRWEAVVKNRNIATN
jgi:tripartite-type tricarboxylate transporter receptor subunit TctC